MGILRFILALCVVIEHSNWRGPSPLRGYDAVHMFFVISGFYMALILRQKYGFSSRGLLKFGINRALRLYPGYLAVVVATLLWSAVCHWVSRGTAPLIPLAVDADHLGSVATIPVWLSTFTLVGVDLPNWFCYTASNGFTMAVQTADSLIMPTNWLGNLLVVPQAWSIGAEICFYALATLVAKGCGIRAVLFAAASYILLRLGHNLLHGGYFLWPLWVWIFNAGILSYIAYERLQKGNSIAIPQKYMVVFGHGFATAVVLIFPMMELDFPKPLLVLATACMIPILFSVSKNSVTDRYIGNLSYSIYLIHVLAGKQCQFIIAHLGISWAWLPLLTICLSIICAVAMVHLIENPIESIRRKIASVRA